MTEDNISNVYDAVIELFSEGKVLEASAVMDAAILADPNSDDGLHLRLIRARAIENGDYSGGRDLWRAYLEYRELEPWVSLLGAEVLVGAGRSLFMFDVKRHSEEITRLLSTSLKLGETAHAHMLMGATLEEHGKKEAARQHFLRAFILGLPWGLRYFAASHMASCHYVRGILSHILATLVSPFLVWRFGPRGPFRGRYQAAEQTGRG